MNQKRCMHPQKMLNNPKVLRCFLQRLAQVAPSGCKMIVMTDAGFHASWFKMVSEQGWEFVGRVRGRVGLQLKEDGPWIPARDLYSSARTQVRDIGLVRYVRTNPLGVRAVLSKRPRKGRHRLNIYGTKRRGHHSAKDARSAREPWLVVSSLGLRHLHAEAIVALYSQRMRIEQSFRDIKNQRLGLGLDGARSRSGPRLEMLLLIAHLVSFVQRLISESARQQQLELEFTPTRRESRHEISVLLLGRRILDIAPHYLRQLIPWRSVSVMAEQARRACPDTF